MKVEADSISELFKKSGKYEEILRAIDSVASAIDSRITPKLYKMDSMNFVGYAPVKYIANDSFGGVWPSISIAPQKNNANLYISAYRDNRNILQDYSDKLGKVICTKSGCCRIKKLQDLNLENLKIMLTDIVKYLSDNDKLVFD